MFVMFFCLVAHYYPKTYKEHAQKLWTSKLMVRTSGFGSYLSEDLVICLIQLAFVSSFLFYLQQYIPGFLCTSAFSNIILVLSLFGYSQAALLYIVTLAVVTSSWPQEYN